MAEIPESLRYTEEHEYLRETDVDGEYHVGITDYAQGELGDVVFIEFPQIGDRFDRMEPFGNIEAVKAVSELFCPLAGEIVDVNTQLPADWSVVNTDPYGEGWMIRLRLDNPGQLDDLLSAADYRKHSEDAE